MKVLGIETSCDETAVCLLEGEGNPPAGGRSDFKFKLLGNALISQAKLHEQFGGVFPNLAKREHAKNLVPMLEAALKDAGGLQSGKTAFNFEQLQATLEREQELFALLIDHFAKYRKPEIDAIAVTHGPGLEPALWVGINFAKALSAAWDIPIVAVNHMEGHIFISMIRNEKGVRFQVSGSSPETYSLEPITFPMLALLISGGHTELVLSKQFGEYELIGQTRDDAAGEAFDKVARLLSLPYPGGPEISRLAEESRKLRMSDIHNYGSRTSIKLPRPMLNEKNFDFSFSGLKTAVRRIVEVTPPTEDQKLQLAREFEDAVADVLVAKTLRAVDEFGASTVVVGGGVSANTYIRHRLADALAEAGGFAKLLIPPPELATDNAIMIALAGYFHAQKGEFADIATLKASGNLRLETKT